MSPAKSTLPRPAAKRPSLSPIKKPALASKPATLAAPKQPPVAASSSSEGDWESF